MPDYYQILKKALQEAPDASPRMRNDIYDRARRALHLKLRQIDPPPPQAQVQQEALLFREAVARIENEFGLHAEKIASDDPVADAAPIAAGSPASAATQAPQSAGVRGGATSPPTQSVTAQAPAAASSKAKRIATGDQEFLPAALEILETPPSPVRIRMLATICLFVVAGLTWSYFGHFDIVAIAQGKFQPTGRVNVVQPLETGKVRAIHVANGTRVAEGQILVEMDASDAQSDVAVLSATLVSLTGEIARRQAAGETLRQRAVREPVAILWPANLPEEARQREQRVHDSDMAQLSAIIASLEAQRLQKQAEEFRVTSTILAQEQFVATLRERVDMREALVARAAGARANVIDALERLHEQQTQLANLRGQLKETQASLVVIGREIEKNFQTVEADNNQRLLQAQRQKDEIEQRLQKANARLKNTFLRAPNAGVVQALSVINVGQVVAAGEQIMRVVPDGLGLEIEGYVLNKDIGFIKEGQMATIKVDSFPFTRWGTIDARVTKIAQDAIPLPEASLLEANPSQTQRATVAGGAQRTQNLVYQVTLAPLQDKIGPEGEKAQIMPGMTVTLEIKTGSRRIISYLFTPLVEVGSTAMRER